MTVDDVSSIYVGGLPYDATEESLRRIFDIYGAVVAVKIINDRTVGGKCYGFVTFANPRSAGHAIDDMDGRTIDGRVVRVNEVKTRGGRSSFGRERVERKFDRGMEIDRGRGRGREKDHDRYHNNHREWSRDRDQEREREYDRMRNDDRVRVDDRVRDNDRVRDVERVRDDDRPRDRLVDRDRMHEHNKDLDNMSRDRGRSRDFDWERDVDSDRVMQRTSPDLKFGEKDKNQMPELLDRSYSAELGKRSRSADSSDDGHGEAAKQLEISNSKLQKLQEEIAQIEDLAEEKKQHVLSMQDRAQVANLEESLTAAKKVTSLRQMQLSKLQKSYQQVRDYTERLKTCEQELQSLVESTVMEMDYPDGLATRDGILAHGS